MDRLNLAALLCATAVILSSGFAHAGDRTWTAIPPSGGVANGFVSTGGDLWMYQAGVGSALKSTDGGATWQVQTQVPAGGQIVVSPHDAQFMYRGGQSKIHRSTDGGATWSTFELPTSNVFGDFVKGIAFHHGDPAIAYASVQDVGVFTTVDAGVSWSLMPTQPPSKAVVSIASDPHDSAVLYLGILNDMLYRSGDNGATWNAVPAVPLGTADVIAFDPLVPGRVLVGADSSASVYRSVDSGASWTKLTGGLPSSGVTTSSIVPGDEPDEFYITFDSGDHSGTGQRAFKSTDGGVTWTGLTSPTAARGPQTTAIYVDPNIAGRLVLGTRIGNFISTDDGATWDWSNEGFRQTGISAFDFGNDPGEIVVASRLGGLLRTDDAGATWTHMNDGIDNPDFVGVAVSPHDAQHLIATDFYGPYASTDGGNTWTVTNYPNMVVHALTISPHDGNVAYAISDGGTTLLKTTDGGLTWSPFATGSTNVSSGIPTKIVASTQTAGLLYFNHHSGLYKSTDGGQTWVSVSGDFPGAPVWEVALAPDDTVYAYYGGVPGIKRSTDGGATWETAWSGIPISGARTIAFDPRTPERILVANGVAVVGSVDGGKDWVDLTDGIDTSKQSVVKIAFDPHVEGRYFFAHGGANGTDATLYVYEGGIAVDTIASATADASSVHVDEAVTVEFSVSNLAGYTAAAGGSFTVEAPSTFELTEWQFTDATCTTSGTTLTCTLPAVAVDADFSGTVTLTGATVGTGSVKVTVTPIEHDIDSTNNTVTVGVNVIADASNPPSTPNPPAPPAESGGGGHAGWLLLIGVLPWMRRRRVQ